MSTTVLSLKGILATDPKFYPHKTDIKKDRAWCVVGWKDHNGKWKSLPFSAFGQLARIMSERGSKGQKVTVVGPLHKGPDEYEEIIAQRFQLGPRGAMLEDKDDSMMKRLIDRDLQMPQQWTMKSAYEANKKSNTCVVCGSTLSLHPAVGVLYCNCVENLPKE